jgi:hypothetical protein
METSRLSFLSRARKTSPIPPGPEGREDFVGTELRARHKRHVRGYSRRHSTGMKPKNRVQGGSVAQFSSLQTYVALHGCARPRTP